MPFKNDCVIVYLLNVNAIMTNFFGYVCCDCVGCIVGDEVDGVPGIQHVVPSFGRKTALKLIKKHGSLETLLNAAAVRTVGRPYAQDALTKYADYLRRNYEVLALKRYWCFCIYLPSHLCFCGSFCSFTPGTFFMKQMTNSCWHAAFPPIFNHPPYFNDHGSQFLTGI